MYWQNHWLALLLLIAGLGCFAWAWRRRVRNSPAAEAWLGGAAFTLLGLGGHFSLFANSLGDDAANVPMYLVLGSGGLLILAFLLLVFSGSWNDWLGWSLLAVLVLGIGAWGVEPAATGLVDSAIFLSSLEPAQPWWLLLLLLIPMLVWQSWGKLAGLGPVRRWVALGLRCLIVLLLALALAETHARQQERNVTVLYLWDQSLSIPGQFAEGRDLRRERIFRFINDSVVKRGAGHDRDRVGVIVFAKRPRLELPPAAVEQLNFNKVQSQLNEGHTDIASAIKLALASFPEGSGKRIVIISDGNENLGKADEQARIAKQNGVQIDVVPIAAGQHRVDEVLVERIEAPSLTERNSRVPLRVVLRSFHPDVVVGDLQLIKMSLDITTAPGAEQAQPVLQAKPVLQKRVKLRHGLNVFFFQQPGLPEKESFSFEARFLPSHVESVDGKKLDDKFAGDHVQNNRASTSVLARGQRAVLLIEPVLGEHKLLADRLAQGGSLKVIAIEAGRLPNDPAQLALVLSKFDSVILANVPAESLSETQQKILRSNTHDQGAGLVMIGGPNGFGAGGWQGTEVEKALPVTADLKSSQIEAKSGLVMMMHASEMAEGNAWQKKIAQLAINKLSRADMIGMIYFAWDGKGHTWHIPFTQIGNQRARILRDVDSMQPGDMPDVDPQLIMAMKELTKGEYGLGTKHIIFISDGDHWNASPNLLRLMGRAGITCTTVCITTHGQAEIDKMKAMAYAVRTPSGKRGRAYHIKNPNELIAIYIKEARLVSQSFLYEKPFQPIVNFESGPTAGLGQVSKLHGMVRTARRPSPLVEVPIISEKIGKDRFPILAHWHYGLGKGVAFTSDARTNPDGEAHWDRDWANSNIYGQFWKQTVEWSLRAVESGNHLFMTTEQRDGKVRVTIEAQDSDKKPLTSVKLKAGITSPNFKDAAQIDLKFEQKSAGIYEAEFEATDVGSYFLNVQGKWLPEGSDKEMVDSVRTGITVPYSPEFAEMESNAALLERLADKTGGKVYEESDELLNQVANSGEVFRPVTGSLRSLQSLWYFLVAIAGLAMFFDVASRRISLHPAEVTAKAHALWTRLRREPVEEAVPFLERLKSRKAEVGDALEKEKSSRRFEPTGATSAPIASADESKHATTAPPKSPTTSGPGVGPEKKEDAGDFASRLMRAKKRAFEDRDKDKDK